MVIGIDFDNTIVSYDLLFKKLAQERGLVGAEFPVNKTLIRDHLRQRGEESLWTAMQGEAYGARMVEALPFPGVKPAIARLLRAGISVRIISHKTRFPFAGPQFDLQQAARDWLERENFWHPDVGMLPEQVFFEPTKEAKLERIRAEACAAFVDDLPEILTAPLFPSFTRRFLFDPEGTHRSVTGLDVFSDWGLFVWP